MEQKKNEEMHELTLGHYMLHATHHVGRRETVCTTIVHYVMRAIRHTSRKMNKL